MAGNTGLITKAGRAFDKVRRRLTDQSTTYEVEILKPSATADEYTTLATASTGWFFDSEKGELYIASDGFTLGDEIAAATNVRIGERVFFITPDDITPPDELGGPRVYWTFRLEKFAKRSAYTNLY